jgi:hypothetical protein
MVFSQAVWWAVELVGKKVALLAVATAAWPVFEKAETKVHVLEFCKVGEMAAWTVYY